MLLLYGKVCPIGEINVLDELYASRWLIGPVWGVRKCVSCTQNFISMLLLYGKVCLIGKIGVLEELNASIWFIEPLWGVRECVGYVKLYLRNLKQFF